MNTPKWRTGSPGQIILSLALIMTSVAMVAFLFNGDHLGNPAWHPHARFHGAQTAGIGMAMGLLGLWLLWRPTTDRRPGIIAAAVLAAIPPLSEFGALLVPGTSPIPNATNPNTISIWGLEVPGNLIAFAAMLILIAVGLTLALRGLRSSEKENSIRAESGPRSNE
ncbi:conserved membrane hypothetical protein [Microbacterium sp. C448]|uniref:DUF6640 family protein n=1 Tax=Microbacterium sp. C448 TaxID=1177594 RepID=UPI0003DE2FC3|nr:DUF6640 family protein [Microbacterium sp. C448]CDJ99808.1 conserved membrane hypothetical protein [Microbacterium sp. C448]